MRVGWVCVARTSESFQKKKKKLTHSSKIRIVHTVSPVEHQLVTLQCLMFGIFGAKIHM